MTVDDGDCSQPLCCSARFSSQCLCVDHGLEPASSLPQLKAWSFGELQEPQVAKSLKHNFKLNGCVKLSPCSPWMLLAISNAKSIPAANNAIQCHDNAMQELQYLQHLVNPQFLRSSQPNDPGGLQKLIEGHRQLTISLHDGP